MTTSTYRLVPFKHLSFTTGRALAAVSVVALVIMLGGCSSEDGQSGADAESGDTGNSDPPVVKRCGTAVTNPDDDNMDAGGDVNEPGDTGDIDGSSLDTSPGDVGPSDIYTVDTSSMDADAAAQPDSGPMNDTGPDAGMEGYPPLPESFSYESSYDMRFTDFQFADSSAGSSVNFVIDNFLDQSREFPIVVLMHFREFDREAGTVELRGGAGVKVDKECNPSERPSGECNYDWDPGTPENYREIPLNPETGELDGGLNRLKFVARTKVGGEVSVTTLTIQDLIFTDAALRPRGDSGEVGIESGKLEGYITYEDAQDAVVKVGGSGIPVASLLREDRLNYDSDGDGELDAWCMAGTFSAGETNIVE